MNVNVAFVEYRKYHKKVNARLGVFLFVFTNYYGANKVAECRTCMSGYKSEFVGPISFSDCTNTISYQTCPTKCAGCTNCVSDSNFSSYSTGYQRKATPERVIVKRVAPHIHTVVRRDIMVLRQTVHPGAAHAPVVAHHPRAQHRQRVAISHREPRVLMPRVRTNIHPITIGNNHSLCSVSPIENSTKKRPIGRFFLFLYNEIYQLVRYNNCFNYLHTVQFFRHRITCHIHQIGFRYFDRRGKFICTFAVHRHNDYHR